MDIFEIKDKSLADLDNLPDPNVLAANIMENLQSAMDSFQELMATLKKKYGLRMYKPKSEISDWLIQYKGS